LQYQQLDPLPGGVREGILPGAGFDQPGCPKRAAGRIQIAGISAGFTFFGLLL
jgi:hypothetical protein